MPEAKDSGKYVYNTVGKLGTGFVASTTRSPSSGSKLQSLFDCKGREVNVIFRAILDVPAVPIIHVCWGD